MLYYRQSWSQSVRIAPAIELSQEEEAELVRLAHSKLSSVRLAERARIVLLAAQGLQNLQIALELGIDRITAEAGPLHFILADLGVSSMQIDNPQRGFSFDSVAAMTPDPPHPADAHDTIRVVGARVNNLADLSVELPKRRLSVFTGVSGSGKSSLVFDTLAAESQRLINETYSAFLQGFMPTMARPEVDMLDGLTTAILVLSLIHISEPTRPY